MVEGMLSLHTYPQIYSILKGQGATDYEADQLAAIAMAESGGDPNAHNPEGENSWGMFQINLEAHPSMNSTSARDPVASAFYALSLFRREGPVPWTVTHEANKGGPGDYRQYLRGNEPGDADVAPAVITPPDVFGEAGAPTGSSLELETGGANFDFVWPTIDDYNGDYAAWMDVTGSMAATFGAAGIQMPAGVSEFAKAAWHVANEDADGQSPEEKAVNIALAARYAEEIRVSKLLTPYDLQKIQQDIRIAEPFGSEAVLRSPLGQQGFDDYWAGKSMSSEDTDYMAGYNLAKAGDEPRQTAVSSYLDRIVDEMDQAIELRGQSIEAATSEMRNRVDLFDSANRAFTNIQPFTIPSGAEYIPGFEPDGFATSIGLKSQEANPIHFDPFQMAIDINNDVPRPTSFSEPTLPGIFDQDAFNKALDFYKGML